MSGLLSGSGPGGAPPPHFDNRFAVPPNHFGAHQISPHQQSFVDPNTGHVHHFAHPPPLPPSGGGGGGVTGLLSDITGAFFGTNRRLELGSGGGTFLGRMRSSLSELLYGPQVTSHGPQALRHPGPPPPENEVPEVTQYTLPGYPTPVIKHRRRFRRQTSSIQGNIIRLLKVTDNSEPEFALELYRVTLVVCDLVGLT